MEGQIPEKLKQKRLDRLMRQQMKISLASNRGRVGREYEALVDEIKNGTALCRSYAEAAEVDGFIRVALPEGSAVSRGDYVRVRVTAAHAYDLDAELILE